MSDASATTPNQNATKSPLDVLEEILGKPGAGLSDADRAQADQKVAETLADQEQAKLQEQLAVEEQQQRAEDEAAILQKKQELATVTQSPEYQARVQQEQQEVQAEAAAEEALDGFEIHQIEHTRIDVPEEEL
jgi:hypothetical protein